MQSAQPRRTNNRTRKSVSYPYLGWVTSVYTRSLSSRSMLTHDLRGTPNVAKRLTASRTVLLPSPGLLTSIAWVYTRSGLAKRRSDSLAAVRVRKAASSFTSLSAPRQSVDPSPCPLWERGRCHDSSGACVPMSSSPSALCIVSGLDHPPAFIRI